MQYQVYWKILIVSAIFELSDAVPCERIKPCRCDESRESSIRVDCSDTGLNPENISIICSVVNNINALDLGTNSLSRIIPFSFQDCQTLKILSLANNNLSQLENDVFAGLSELQSLNLDENKLIQYGNFSGPDSLIPLKRLESLSLHSNINRGIVKEYLPNIYGTTIPNVQNLYLDGIPNATFGKNFQTWEQLKRIYFSSKTCNMSTLTDQTFKNVPFLVHLDLSNCRISSVEAGTFVQLTNLIHLNLSYNMELGFPSLRPISYGLQYTKIEVLDFSKVYKTFGLTNQINRCDLWFLRNTTLKKLYIRSNRIALIEINALPLVPSSLEVIYAEDNKFTYGSYILQLVCLKNLKALYFGKQSQCHSLLNVKYEVFVTENRKDTSGGCEVSDYPVKLNCTNALRPSKFKDAKLPENLETVDYSSSSLILDPTVDVPAPVSVKNRIRSANISGNRISSFTGNYFGLYSLEFLNISNNVCRNISDDFFINACNLTHLDASANNLGPRLATDEQGAIFESLTKLVTLDLSNNWIVYLPPKIFTHLRSLEVLHLSSNRLENITFEYGEIKNLSKLYLRQNKITTLPSGLLDQMNAYFNSYSKNITIDLSDNSLSFLCDNIYFLKWMKKHPSYFVDIQNYMFHNSSQSSITYEQFLSSFESFEKSCKSYTAVIVVSAMFLAVFISLIVCGVVYRYRWRLRYFYYMTKARYKGYIPVRDNVDIEFQYDAFISYANENYRFVTIDVLQKLEEAGLKLCLHQKDFLPGNYIAENILDAIRKSKKTVIVLSNDFLQSKWCMYEFNMARMEGIYSRGGGNVLVVVRYEPFDIVNASTELRECLEYESYLEYTADENEGPYFWQMLIQAIRDPSGE